jgi:uncharacterized protein YciI
MDRPVRSRIALVLGLAVALVGCRSAGGVVEGPQPAVFTLVLLRSDPSPPELDEARRAELFRGHFGFMAERAEAGELLLAGPFDPFDKAAPDLRGIFVLDVPDADRGLEIASADPTTRAGIFRQEAFTFATLDVLRELPAMEQARQEARAAAGEDMSVPDVVPYVILTAEDGEAGARVLGHGALAILAIDDSREAKARLAIANEAGTRFEVSEWAGSPVLLDLAQRGR